jgi:hypothetical protein
VRKILLPQGIDPRTVQAVASRYTDYAIPAKIATAKAKYFIKNFPCAFLIYFSLSLINQQQLNNLPENDTNPLLSAVHPLNFSSVLPSRQKLQHFQNQN